MKLNMKHTIIDVFEKNLSTGKLKVVAQLQSQLCLVGCGVNPKHFEGIIDRYVGVHPLSCPEKFELYEQGHPNAIIYEAIKSYLFTMGLFGKYYENDISEIFWYSYCLAWTQSRNKDLWYEIPKLNNFVRLRLEQLIPSNHDKEGEKKQYKPDPFRENIIWGIVIFLLSNAIYPNAKYLMKDLIRLEKQHLEQSDSFLPYLWKAFMEYGAESIEVHPTKETEKTQGDVDETTEKEPLILFTKRTEMLIWKERLIHFYGDKINTPLNCSKYNHILRCLVCFLEVWQKQDLLIKRPNRDVIRFLERCGFKRDGVTAERIAGVLGELIVRSDELGKERELVRKYMESIVENT